MLDSVRMRLTLWYAAVLAVALIAFALLVYSAAARGFYERQDESLRSTAATVASAYLEELAEQRSTAKASEVVLVELVFPNRYVAITDTEGQVIAQAGNLTGQRLIVPAASLSEARQRGIGFKDSNGLRVAISPVFQDQNKQPGFVVVAESLNVVSDSLRSLRRSFYTGVPLILILASLGGY